jgi:short subunit dehydrogenase-like uncharacterized protein
MAAAIVLFGATGYTGRLTAQALVGRGAKPVLAARSEDRLRQLAHDLGGLEWITADVSRPETVRDAVPQGAVLVSTVGPFTRWGGPAIEAALAARASYLDSTGETPFIREVFERHGPRAEAAGCGLVTAFGYDWVPGNLAGALALREAGDAAVRVVVAYYFTGRAGTPSGGTRASSAGVMLEPSFAYRDGRIVTERPAKRMQEFQVDGKRRPAISVGSTEHFALPRLHPGLREVDVYLGWFGSMSRGLQVMSAGTSLVTKVPGVRPALQAVAGRAVKGSTGGPDEEARSKSGSHILAKAFGADGRQLTEVRVAGADGYTFTGEVLAWGAIRAAERGLEGTGALGPVDAFGLDELERGVASAGIERVL